MLDQVKEYIIRLSKGDYCFFTLSGKSEVGKTLLLNDIRRFVHKHSDHFDFKHKKSGDVFIYYSTLSELVSDCLDNYKLIDKLKKCGILFIEELFSPRIEEGNKYSNLLVEKAFEILNLRSHKPVVIDTNKSIKEIEFIDVRIHSRLYRDGGVVLDLPKTLTPYLSRNASKTNQK